MLAGICLATPMRASYSLEQPYRHCMYLGSGSELPPLQAPLMIAEKRKIFFPFLPRQPLQLYDTTNVEGW